MFYYLLNLIILAYPLYATLLILKKPKKDTLVHWCTFWFVYECLGIIGTILSYIPFTTFFQYCLLFALYAPMISHYFRRYIILGVYRDSKRWITKNVNLEHLKGKASQYLEKTINIVSNFSATAGMLFRFAISQIKSQ